MSNLINKILNNAKFMPPLHLWAGLRKRYSYCGPFTPYSDEYVRTHPPINILDEKCQEHDRVYTETKDNDLRTVADRELAKAAKEIYQNKENPRGLRLNSFLVHKAMTVKNKFGLGLEKRNKKRKRCHCNRSSSSAASQSSCCNKKQTINFGRGVSEIKRKITSAQKKGKFGHQFSDLVRVGVRAANQIFKNKKVVKIPKLLKISGGFIQFIPALSALAAIGSLGSSISNIYKNLKKARQQNQEETHVGNGLIFKKHKKGMGLYIRPYEPRNYY